MTALLASVSRDRRSGDLVRSVHHSNAVTRDMWTSMHEHRARVMREVDRLNRRGRLCVLGAGNCNDLDLAALVAHFEEVHLVDLDRESLALGVDRQLPRGSPGVFLHAPVDFAGVTLELPPYMTSLRQVAAYFRESVDALSTEAVPTRCDVIVSACVVSQLVRSVVERFGDAIPGIHDLATEVRNRHVDLLIQRGAPGGAVLLVADMVSSDTAPTMLSCPNLRLAALRDQLIRERNFFHGTNPYAIEDYLTKRHSASLHATNRAPPWRWRIGDRTLLVNSIRVDLASGTPRCE